VDRNNADLLIAVLRQCLDEGVPVEIDGLGRFQPSAGGGYVFEPRIGERVFIAYVQEDLAAAEVLFDDLHKHGFDPWLDRRKLMPGQNWPRAIERAIKVSDFFVACFSRRSVAKRGQFQSELRWALDCASRVPLDQVYFVPVRLDDCPVPARISREIQYVDLFPDWDKGLARILETMTRHRQPGGGEPLRLAT
jgi:TIR domain-containing protein